MAHIVLIMVFGALLLPALAMSLIPLFPTFWYLLAVAGVFLLIDGFAHITAANFTVLLALVLFSVVIDWSAGLLGAKFGGAAWKSLIYGAAGSVVGLFILPPFGIFAGLFAGVLIGELLRQRTEHQALRAAAGALIGSISGVMLNVVLALFFIVLFIVFSIG